MKNLNFNDLPNRKLEHAVENKTIYNANHAELTFCETFEKVSGLAYSDPNPLLACMLTGKKKLILDEDTSFDFLADELIFSPNGVKLNMDYPQASLKQPTKCIKVTFDQTYLTQIVEKINLLIPRENSTPWQLSETFFHFNNDAAINQLLKRIAYVFTENNTHKDVFVDLILQELMIRILQLENKKKYIDSSLFYGNSNRFAYIVNYIHENLHNNLNIKLLSSKANMSEANFYRTFRHEFGISPNEFIIEERVKLAEQLLKSPDCPIKEVYLNCGFSSFSYFCKVFKKKHGVQPSQYRSQHHL